MTRTPLIALLSLSLSLGLTAAAAAPALACGGPTRDVAAVTTEPSRQDQARALIEDHFAALARGDARAVRRLWAKHARVVSRDADGTAVRTQKLPAALKRWLAHRDGLTWTIDKVAERFDGNLEVRATVTWNGVVFDDAMTVALDGGARIVGKSSTARPAEQPASLY